MKTRSILLSLLATVSLASFVSCVNQLEDDGMSRKEKKEFEAIPNGTPMNVKFHIGDIKCSTRSSFTTEEDAVSNLNILVYRAGELITSAYTEDVDESVIILRLAKGEQYNLYALANCGEVSLKTESELLAYQYTIPSLSSLNNGYPMCWSRTDFTISTIVPDVSIELERLVAKVSFSLDPGVLDGLEVTSVRLMQSSKVVSPFGLNRAAASSSQVMAGDYASATDLTQLNNGGSIIMYVPENCQGTLLEGNTDPWGKTPDNISKGDVCTYIEVGCSFSEGFALSGDVIYRMYLGNDNCANFDVVRNSIYNISLLLTGDGLNEVSWKVDSDVDYNGEILLANAWIEKGLHESSNLYIGEVFQLGFKLDDSLNKLLNNKIINGSIEIRSKTESLTPKGNISYNESNQCYYLDISCVNSNTDELFLFDTTTNSSICNLIACRIKKPLLRVSNQSSIEIVSSNYNINTLILNGSPEIIYLYLVDGEGKNLLCTEQYLFNTSLFNDVGSSISTYQKDYVAALSYSECSVSLINTGYTVGTNQPLASLNIELNNPDPRQEIATDWAKLWALQRRGEDVLYIDLSAALISKTERIKNYFDIIRPVISWDLLNAEVLSITNPSNIEIKSELWEIFNNTSAMKNQSSYTAITTTGYAGMSLPWGDSQIKPLYIHKIDFSTREQSNYSKQDNLGRIITEYRFQQDCPQSILGGGAAKVTISTIDGEAFEYDYSCNYYIDDPDLQSPEAFQYDNYDTPHTEKMRFGSIGGYNGILQKISSLYSVYNGIKQATEYSYKLSDDDSYCFKDFVEMYTQKASRPHAKINISYDNYGIAATIISNPYNIEYKIGIEEGSVSGTCKWRSFNTQSYTTDTHTIPIPLKTLRPLDPNNYYYKDLALNIYDITGTNKCIALSSSDIALIFQNLNIGCWHNASENAIATAGNRRSNFTLPKSLDVKIQAKGTSRLIPVDIYLNGQASNQSYSVTSTVQGVIYSSTKNGIYSADEYGENNIDHTTRDKKSISNVSVVSSETAVESSAKNYTLNIAVGEGMTKNVTYYIR